MRPLLSVVEHLGLYATFHRSQANRRIHSVSLVVICFTGFVALSWLPLPRISSVSAAVVVPLGAVLSMALIDPLGALCLGLWLLPLFWAACVAAPCLGPWPALPLLLGIHCAAWFFAVAVGNLDYGHISAHAY